MKYTTIIFDFDGTLVDSQEGIAKGFQVALAAYGVEEDLLTIKGLIGPPLSKTIITKYGFSEEDGANAMAIHRRYLTERSIYECSTYDGVREMLQALSDLGLTLAIATNRPESSTLPLLEHLGWTSFFKAIVGNDDLQLKGTKSDFVRMAMEACNVTDPSQAVMVGDRAHDIEGGKDNALDTIGVLYGYGSKEEMDDCHPTYIVETPKDIVAIAQKS